MPRLFADKRKQLLLMTYPRIHLDSRRPIIGPIQFYKNSKNDHFQFGIFKNL
jgi:hypothetical protein